MDRAMSDMDMNETFDFVVAGSGGGSMCAALLLRSVGKSVVILEKTDLIGGTTAMSGGVMWIPNNRFMKEAGIEDSHDKAAAYFDAVTGNRDDSATGATRARRLAYVEEAPKMIDFLVAQGIKLRRIPSWPDYYDQTGASVPGRTVVAQLFNVNELGPWKDRLRPGFVPAPVNLDEAMQLPWVKQSWAAKKALLKVVGRVIGGRLTGKKVTTAGEALQGRMLQAALKSGADIRVNSPVKRLIVEDGRVTGVVTEKDGKEWRVGARLGVLINAGGFAHNQQMLDTYTPGMKSEWSNAGAGDTGEMIEEAARVGAALGQMDKRLGNENALPPGGGAMKPVMQGAVSKPHAIVVDKSGMRYMAEACSYIEFCERMIERNKTSPAVPSWMIVDSQFMKKYGLMGAKPGSKKLPPLIASGFVRTGNTLDELAKACALDATVLRATVDRFNTFARNGEDEDFHRGDWVYHQWLGDPYHTPSQTLGTIEEGPFYAVEIYPGDVSTLGGVVTDVNARVLRADGTPIPGLYATGTSAATVMAGNSPGAGASIGPSFTWGYVAAKHAANAGNSINRSQ
jgi:3-oxosteroid 1-dehydrogenase